MIPEKKLRMSPLNTLKRCEMLGREPPLDLLVSLAVVPAPNILENNELRRESQHEDTRDHARRLDASR